MEKNTIILLILVLIIGLGIGYALSGGSLPARQSLGVGGMSQNIDQRFIVQMIPHHEDAIEMAKVALERSKRPEIISLAKGIIEAQTREITDMRAWYQSWFDSAPPEGGMGGMRMGGMTGEIDDLKATSVAEFDREFMEQMIPHHEMAIMMAQMLAAATERPEMQQLADNIMTSQAREIEMMMSWLKSWYGN